MEALRPHTSASIPAVENSDYANLKSGDQRIVNIAIDGYLKKAKETGDEYATRVESLRGIFSTPEKIAELKRTTLETGYKVYEPGFAKAISR